MKTINLDLNSVKTSISIYEKGVDTVPEEIKAISAVKSFLSPKRNWAAMFVCEEPTQEQRKMNVAILISVKSIQDFNFHEFTRRLSNNIIRTARKGLTTQQRKSVKNTESFYRTLVFDKIESELLEEHTVGKRVH